MRARCRLFTSNNLGCDPESQLDFIAHKTCAIGGEPMLTAGGKEYRSEARINVNPQRLTTLIPQLRVPPRRQNPARSVASMGSDAGCSGSSCGWACNNREDRKSTRLN